MVGDTCFIEVTIPADFSEAPTDTMGTLAALIETMIWGEEARFVLDLEDHKVKAMFAAQRLHHRAQQGDIPDDATSLILFVSVFRIVRGNREYRKKHRGGTDGFSM